MTEHRLLSTNRPHGCWAKIATFIACGTNLLAVFTTCVILFGVPQDFNEVQRLMTVLGPPFGTGVILCGIAHWCQQSRRWSIAILLATLTLCVPVIDFLFGLCVLDVTRVPHPFWLFEAFAAIGHALEVGLGFLLVVWLQFAAAAAVGGVSLLTWGLCRLWNRLASRQIGRGREYAI